MTEPGREQDDSTADVVSRLLAANDRLTRDRNDARRLAEQWREVGETQLGATQRLVAERKEARRLTTMLLEYGTEGLEYDSVPDWTRGKQG